MCNEIEKETYSTLHLCQLKELINDICKSAEKKESSEEEEKEVKPKVNDVKQDLMAST